MSCLAKAGEVERAEELFHRLSENVNDLGVLAVEIDTGNSAKLGNFPQAFGHIGLITAAWEIDNAKGTRVKRGASYSERLAPRIPR